MNGINKIVCPICGECGDNCYVRWTKIYEGIQHKIAYCRLCHFGFTFPSHSLESLKRFLDRPQNPFFNVNNYDFQKDLGIFTWTAEKLKKYLGREGQLLDVGCGSGHFIRELRTLGWQVWGTEIDPELVEVVNKNGIDCYLDDITEIQLPDNIFDIITFRQVLEYMPTPPLEVFSICRRWLRPGGLMYINIAENLDWTEGIMGRLYPKPLYPNVKNYHFSKLSLEKSLLRSNLRPIEWCIQPPSKEDLVKLIGYWILKVIDATVLHKWNGIHFQLSVIAQKDA